MSLPTLQDRLQVKQLDTLAPLLASTATMVVFAFARPNTPAWVQAFAIGAGLFNAYAAWRIGRGVVP